MTERLVRSSSASFGGKDNEGYSKHREDGITKSSRNMPNGIGCIIMKVRVPKHHDEGILG